MTILLTGGAGFIGSHTAVACLEASYDVVIADNFYNSSPETPRRVEKITGRHVTVCEADIADKAALRRVFDAQPIDAVIHFAGLKAVGESVAQPWRYYDNNLNTTLVLTKVMTDVGCKKIIFSSSATVYSGDNEMPLRETSRTGSCTNPYGWTKYMTEQILSGIAFADKEWSVVLLRYFNPIGAHPSALIGELPRGVPQNLVPYITQTAAGLRECLSVFGDDYPTPDGSNIRDYIDVVDLAKAHVTAIARMIEGKNREKYEIFNIGTGRGVSVLELVRKFEEVNNLKLNYKIVGRRAGDIVAIWADPSYANDELGWKAERSLDQTLAAAWKWEKHIRGIE